MYDIISRSTRCALSFSAISHDPDRHPPTNNQNQHARILKINIHVYIRCTRHTCPSTRIRSSTYPSGSNRRPSTLTCTRPSARCDSYTRRASIGYFSILAHIYTRCCYISTKREVRFLHQARTHRLFYLLFGIYISTRCCCGGAIPAPGAHQSVYLYNLVVISP